MSVPSPVDLESSARLAVLNIYSSLDERRAFLPFFTYRLFDDPIALEHGSFDSPHVVGRYLDALAAAARSFDVAVRADVIDALEQRLYRCLDIGRHRGTGLAWNEETGRQVVAAWGHNQREALLALLAIASLRGPGPALDRAGDLVRDVARHMDRSGVFPGAMLDDTGWKQHHHMSAPPAQSGRMIRALLHYYRACGDRAGLGLAIQIARHNVESCFAPDGTWKPEAGIHVHSITGLITSLIDLGILIKDDALLDAGRRAFDVGLAPYRSTFGWVQEMRGTPHERGEANNTADVLEGALLLAQHVDRSYWEDAERVLRNHLLRSQLTDPSPFASGARLVPDDDRIFEGVAERAVGGFCFSSPGDFKSHDQDRAPINTDLVGGALQGICEAHDVILTESATEVFVNLHLSRSGRVCSVASWVPHQGRIDVTIEEPRSVYVRIPRSVARPAVRVWLDGSPTDPVWVGQYVSLTERPQRMRATITFPLDKHSTVEVLNGKEYGVEWLGETVTAVHGPRDFFRPLY